MKISEFEQNGQSTKLVVLLHAYTHTPENLCCVRRVIKETWSDADIFLPDLKISSWISCTDPISIVIKQLKHIDEHWKNREERADKASYEEIILVGYSLGALLARKLYIYACGEIKGKNNKSSPAPFEEKENVSKEKRVWADKVTRIILLAGMNRGWKISHHLSLSKLIPFTLGWVFGTMVEIIAKPLIFYIRRGDPFLTNLRIQWIVMRNNAGTRSCGNAITIQLLGSIDDMSSPEDNIDLISGSDFYYFDVPKSNHVTVIEMNDSSEGQERKRVFQCALTDNKDQLKARSVFPADYVDTNLAKNKDVNDVIFVIHGIRDDGYWTHKIARKIKKLANERSDKKRVVATETSSYGYFPILSFLYPWRRQEKVEWLMDQYAESRAQYPEAEFSYVGHSNGTYLLAKALEVYPCCSFKHVIFAGSVVKTNYDWQTLLKEKRVVKILNYVATGDWVVAWFPRFLEILGLQDVGGAGHIGFQQLDDDPKQQIEYVMGGHSAALDEDNWDAIAEFITDGNIKNIPTRLLREASKGQDAIVKIHAVVIWAILLFGLLGIGWFLLPDLTAVQWRQDAFFTLYILVIYFALTRL